VIVANPERMQEMLERTQASVASLRALLDGNLPTFPVEYRSMPALHAVAIRAIIAWDDTEPWLNDAFAELDRAVATTGA
jgi:hypothetical protein